MDSIDFLLLADEVVYLKQGHLEFYDYVRQNHQSLLPKFDHMPFNDAELRAVEPCRVERIEYFVGPPSICQLSLRLLDDDGVDPRHIIVQYADFGLQ